MLCQISAVLVSCVHIQLSNLVVTDLYNPFIWIILVTMPKQNLLIYSFCTLFVRLLNKMCGSEVSKTGLFCLLVIFCLGLYFVYIFHCSHVRLQITTCLTDKVHFSYFYHSTQVQYWTSLLPYELHFKPLNFDQTDNYWWNKLLIDCWHEPKIATFHLPPPLCKTSYEKSNFLFSIASMATKDLIQGSNIFLREPTRYCYRSWRDS